MEACKEENKEMWVRLKRWVKRRKIDEEGVDDVLR